VNSAEHREEMLLVPEGVATIGSTLEQAQVECLAETYHAGYSGPAVGNGNHSLPRRGRWQRRGGAHGPGPTARGAVASAGGARTRSCGNVMWPCGR